ncbi:scoloptoxin SSD14-like [Dermacentor albipictus]|uniref:scoloptoxin SSD14-like n=1 Tax=Dermacentor albipictus TaxID=60249 RepID=UPI0031FC1DD2
MAITVGTQCCFIFVMLVFIIATIMSASIYSYVYTQPFIHYPSEPWEYRDWAVVSDSDRCAEIAKKIIGDHGSIGDAAVSALACMAVLLPHRCGLGGSLVALYYDRSTRLVTALDAVGVVSTEADSSFFKDNSTLASYGRMAPIVPGAVAGMHAIHKKLGKLNWPSVFGPAIALAQQNYPIGPHFAKALRRNEKRIEPFYGRLFSKVKNVEYLKLSKGLYQLLYDVANKGWKFFYTGKHARRLVNDLARGSGFITLEDLDHYEAHWVQPLVFDMKTHKTVYGVPVPGGGALLGPILDIMDITRRS